MSSFDSDGFNRPPAIYDPSRRRGPLHKDMPGLYWRVKSGNVVVYELKFKVGGELRSETLDGMDEAEAINAWRLARPAHERGEVVLSKGDKTVEDAVDLFLAEFEEKVGMKLKKDKTLRGYRSSAKHLRRVYKGVLLADLTGKAIENLFKQLRREGLAEWTMVDVKKVLKHTLAKARSEGWIRFDPVADADPDYLPKQRVKPGYAPMLFTNEQLVAMFETCNPIYRRMFIVMALTGLRIGELCGLRWADVIDLTGEDPYLDVTSQLGVDEDGDYDQVDPKGRAGAATNLSIREVGLLDGAVEALKAQRAAEWEKGFGQDDDWVFTTTGYNGRVASGQPVLPDNFRSRGVKPAAVDAEVGDVRPHDFRHTTASILAAEGVPDFEAAAWMGHTVEVYRDTYAKAFKNAKTRKKNLALLRRSSFNVVLEAV